VFPTYHWREILHAEPQIDVVVRAEGEATAPRRIAALQTGSPLAVTTASPSALRGTRSPPCPPRCSWTSTGTASPWSPATIGRKSAVADFGHRPFVLPCRSAQSAFRHARLAVVVLSYFTFDVSVRLITETGRDAPRTGINTHQKDHA
jgi:hypothetical protein